MRCNLLEIEGCYNIRDIGGYHTSAGKAVKHLRFIRSGSLFGLTEQGKSHLLDLGLRCVIDLRSHREVSLYPDAIMGDSRFSWHHLPMLDYIYSNKAQGLPDSFPPSLEEMYISLLEESRDGFRQLFELFAHPDHQGYVFHCMAGKDRTGIVAALLLSLAGVDEQTIVEDYAHSEELLRDILAKVDLGDLPNYVLASRPQTMQVLLRHLEARYGGAQSYLNQIGIAPVAQAEVLKKLLD